MAVGIGPGVAGEKTRQKIAIGKCGLVSKSNHDQVKRRDHIEALLFRPNGGNEILGAAGVELVAIDGQLQIRNALESGDRRRPVQPEANPVSRIGHVPRK